MNRINYVSSFHFFINIREGTNFHEGIRSPIIPIKDPPIWLTGNFHDKTDNTLVQL